MSDEIPQRGREKARHKVLDATEKSDTSGTPEAPGGARITRSELKLNNSSGAVVRKSSSSNAAKFSMAGVFISAAILLLTMGVRQSTGLFLLPIITSTGLGIASVSFALAIGQFVWGAAQPVFGAVADKYGSDRVIIAGALILAAGSVLTPQATTQLGLVGTMGMLSAAGAAAGSFSILIGAAAKNLPANKRSFAAGVINAGGSLGQFLFAPLLQLVIALYGWASGMYTMAALALLTIPLAWVLRANSHEIQPLVPVAGTRIGVGEERHSVSGFSAGAERSLSLSEQLRVAMRDPSYLCLHAGFFTCGFHIAFLVTHFPGDLQLCGLSPAVAANSLALIGLFNVGGSLVIGWLGERHRMKYLLASIYVSRAALITAYLLMPKTAANVYLIAAGLGFTWLATVPPTAGIVGKLFGARYLGTLFGLTLMSHQIGGFLGAWLGGVAMAKLGSYQWVWYADIVLALLAGAVNLPIREARVVREPLPA